MLETIKISDNSFSIKDLSGDIRLSDSKWDFIFELMEINYKKFFFSGFRLNYQSDELGPNINILSNRILLNKNDYKVVFLELENNAFMFNRNMLSKLWDQYEYPGLVFTDNSNDEAAFIHYFGSLQPKKPFYKQFKNSYLLYRSFELDVLWIERSSDSIPFLM